MLLSTLVVLMIDKIGTVLRIASSVFLLVQNYLLLRLLLCIQLFPLRLFLSTLVVIMVVRVVPLFRTVSLIFLLVVKSIIRTPDSQHIGGFNSSQICTLLLINSSAFLLGRVIISGACIIAHIWF